MANKKTIYNLRSIILKCIPAVTVSGDRVRGGRLMVSPTSDGGIVALAKIAAERDQFEGEIPAGFAAVESELVEMDLDGVISIVGRPGGMMIVSPDYAKATKAIAVARQATTKQAAVTVADKLAAARHARTL